jgi:hypothetical protein
LADGLLALVILVLFIFGRGFLREYGQYAKHKGRERLAKRYRRWVMAERPDYDSSKQAYASLMSGGFERRQHNDKTTDVEERSHR